MIPEPGGERGLSEGYQPSHQLEELYPNNEDIHLPGEAYQMMGRYNEGFDDVLSLISAKDDYNSTLPLLVARAANDTYSFLQISAEGGQWRENWTCGCKTRAR